MKYLSNSRNIHSNNYQIFDLLVAWLSSQSPRSNLFALLAKNLLSLPLLTISFIFMTKLLKLVSSSSSEAAREKNREIGRLWRMSEHNPHIDNDVLQIWEHVIDEWIADNNMPLIIRKDTNKRGQSFIHPSGREIIVSDNTFAIWVYYCVMNGKTYTLSQLKEMLSSNEIPMVFMRTKDILEKGKYTKPLGVYSLPEWKLCHIEPVGFNSNKSIEELDIKDIQEHFRKYANPNNMFVLPKEIGDLGEIQIFIDEQMKK